MPMEEVQRQRVVAYQPGDQARALLSETKMVLMVGMSGVGRDTIINELIRHGAYYPLVTSTTRLPRANNGIMEQNGVEYYFLTSDQATQHLEHGGYIEVSPVHDHVNGLLVEELQRAHDSGKTAISDVDPQGASKYHQLSDTVTAIFVLPPSYEEWMRRNKQRYASDDEFTAVWPRRRQSAMMELDMAIHAPFYHFVINNQVTHAVNVCDAIAHGAPLDRAAQEKGIALARAILASLQAEQQGLALNLHEC